MNKMVNIRRFTSEGSTVTLTVFEEAEAILEKARVGGGLVIDEDTQQVVDGHIGQSVKNVLVLDPIVGG